MRAGTWARLAVIAVPWFVACGPGDEVATVPEPEAPGACAAYATCCADYARSLASLDGYEEEDPGASQDSCLAMSGMQELPGGAEACANALAVLKKAVGPMDTPDGWTVPSSCL